MRDLEQPPEGGQATTNHGRSKINDGRGSRNSERLRMFGNLPRAGPGGPGDGALLVKRRWGNQVANLLRNRGLCGQGGRQNPASNQPMTIRQTNQPTDTNQPAAQATRQPPNKPPGNQPTGNHSRWQPTTNYRQRQPATNNQHQLIRPWPDPGGLAKCLAQRGRPHVHHIMNNVAR